MKRHALSTRLWHWTNAAAVVVLFMSGLNISNAHPRLYWAEWGFEPATAWAIVPRFPGWMTIPGYYSLASARQWHLLFAWVFALALVAIWIAMLANRHFVRDLATRRSEWRWQAIKADMAAHLKLDFSHAGGAYNFLQKLSYGLVLGVLLPGLVATGMGISPGLEPMMRPAIDLVGGRQSMRSLHFLFAWALFAFTVVHVALVLLTGPIGQIRAMITGGTRDGA